MSQLGRAARTEEDRTTIPAAARAAAARFLGAPASPLPFGVLRIGLGLLLLVQALAVAGHLSELYGEHGLVQSPVAEAFVPRWVPRVGWVASALAPLGLDEGAAIRAVFGLYLAAAVAFLVGWRSRAAAICVWTMHLMLTATSFAHTYGVDLFVRIALFYCLFAPIGGALSLDRLAGRTSGTPSFAARLSLRALQIHLAIAYAATGIEKASGAQWWNGEALWRSWMRPDLGTIDFAWTARFPLIAMIGGWATVFLETAYPILVWPRSTRRWCALAILALHAGIAATLGLFAFAFVMMLLTTAAWLVPCEPRTLRRVTQRDLEEVFGGTAGFHALQAGAMAGTAGRLDRADGDALDPQRNPLEADLAPGRARD